MFGGTVTWTPRSSCLVVRAEPWPATAPSTSAERTTWASVCRLVSSSWRTDAGVGTYGFPTEGLTRTRAVLV